MKTRALLAALLALLGSLHPSSIHADVIPLGEAVEIFDDGPIADGGDVEIVNGRIVLTGTKEQKEEQAGKPDPAGDQVLELTDGSQLHGRLVTLGKTELIWQRGDSKEPLIFAPQEVRRIVLAATPADPKAKANATLKLHGDAWLTGELAGLENGKFRLNLAGPVSVEVERGKVEWLHLSPNSPPDAYEGPFGPMGLAGWDAGGGTAGAAWDYADGALVARAAMPITRRFDVLPEKVDIEFTASDGGNAMRGLTLWIQPGEQNRGYSKGSVQLQFRANNITVNSYDGQNIKNFTADLPQDKKAPKITRYRILHNRRSGKLAIFVNGTKAADWDVPEIKEPSPGGSLSWQPNYWNSNMAWTLSKVKVQPWDGIIGPDAKGDEGGKDLLSTGTAARQGGTLDGVSADSIRFGGKDYPRKDRQFIRLARRGADDEASPAVARVWLAQRGEFDVTALGIRDGRLTVRTSFSGDLALPLTAVRAIEFPHRLNAVEKAAAEGGDTLVFRNGDELRGTLVGASHDRSVKWKPVKGDRQAEFAVARLAGIVLAPRPAKTESAGSTAVRFRNGDWLMGELRLLDKQHLLLKSALAMNLQIDRSAVRTLYFGPNGEAPVWDGAGDRDVWMKGAVPGDNFSGRQRKDEQPKRNPWQYLDGSFTLPRGVSRSGYGNGPSLGRTLDNLPDKVEVSFQLSTPKGPAGYAIQLFTEENRPGLMIQGSWDSAYIYDMSPRKQGGVFFNQPQQVDFGEKIGSEGNRRHFRFLADRKTGRLAMFVNGIVVAQFGQRPGKESAKPGKGIAITPQPMNSSATISNLWIAPWSGELPDAPKSSGRANQRAGGNIILNGGVLNLNGVNKAVGVGDAGGKVSADKKNDPAATGKSAEETKDKPAAPATPAADLVALTNGDETSGTVESATAEVLRVKCDVGTLDVPLTRALMAEFAGPPVPAEEGIRFRLAGKGTLTVKSFTLADGKVVCHSATAGDLSFPVAALSEIVFQPRNQTPPANPGTGDAGKSSAPNGIPNIIIQGGGIIRGNINFNGIEGGRINIR